MTIPASGLQLRSEVRGDGTLQLSLVDEPTPQPGANDVVVRIEAAPLNPSDLGLLFGGGCQFLGTAATSQVVGEALGLSLPHSALSPSGQPIWLDMAKRSAKAIVHQQKKGLTTKDILTEASLHNAMTMFAAQTDFSEPGELAYFINPAQLAMLEASMHRKGVLESKQMGGAFALMRAQDLSALPASGL